jgi:lysophospholipase L1-like esterase
MNRFATFAVLLACVATLHCAAQQVPAEVSRTPNTLSPSDPRIQIIGRVDRSDPAHVRMMYPGATIRFRFIGDLAVLQLTSDSDDGYITIIVEGSSPQIHRLAKGANEVVISAADRGSSPHTVEVVKRNGSWQGVTTLDGIRLGSSSTLGAPPPLPERKLLFIGDSVTCGEGIDNYPVCAADNHRSANAYDAYGMVLGRRLDAQSELVCFGGRGVVRDWLGHRDVLNAPQFFNYSIPADNESQRAKWIDDGWTPDAVVISLGTNDWNLQKTDPITEEEFVTKYVGLVRDVRKHYPRTLIVLTQGSIVSDSVLSQWVQETVKRVNDPRVVWFASRHFPGSSCDAHPDKMQQLQMADDFEAELRKLLGW